MSINKIFQTSLLLFCVFFSGFAFGQSIDMDKLISQLTLEEKAKLCAGKDMWNTQDINRLGIPSVLMTDGPHGVRLSQGNNITLPGIKATCFPTASLLASTWDKELVKQMGEALGAEAIHFGVQMLLGPGVNIKRSPLGGRNFEYFSEDPLLTGKLAAQYINGVQSLGIGTSIKHFAANNQETERMRISSEIDERTLREIYLKPFEIAVREAQPTSVMCAYNKINGEYCTENKWLIDNILRNEFGFKGLCISDWGATNDRILGIKAGLDLQMPGDGGLNANIIVDAVKSGLLKETELDNVVRHILNFIFSSQSAKTINNIEFNTEKQHLLANKIASEGIVLLKNNNDILPIQKSVKRSIGVIGLFAKYPRYQGAGSSMVNPTQLDNFLDIVNSNFSNQYTFHYTDGYNVNGETNDSLMNEATKIAKNSSITIVFAGLPGAYESEGIDRKSLGLPEGHNTLIEKIAAISKNVVVVLQNGSPVTMPWVNKVDGILEAYLSGQAGSSAIADILFGKVNPSGKLAETFPQKLSDTPAYLTWPGDGKISNYNEGIFVGYRYYDTKEIKPLFPFGYGLSYTTYEYSDLQVNKTEISDIDSLKIKLKVKNTGKYDGKEIVQLYVRNLATNVVVPYKELKGFEKISLKKGDTQNVEFTLEPKAFQYYSTKYNCWKADTGEYDLLIGSSSNDIHLIKKIKFTTSKKYAYKYDTNSTFNDLMDNPIGAAFVSRMLKGIMAKYKVDGLNEIEKSQTLLQIKMVENSIMEMPIKKMLAMYSGAIPKDVILNLLDKMNKDLEKQ